ncbi:sigma-70 family RNA polymerase sigma factor [Methylonatrum kenyense]|uniref:RNA polymerase sigma factor n=1 Tax=Methylonatrum kenyense TaxID=455253 RepID=UPI0020BE2633|nr:sigma-70 family RNA polymerase sigma factor [Methylonatrum kenyense]MCK8514883.1 sigma-70 family RNA polymerase sigma factor [Methylonatrum kenyense]
MKIDIDQLYRDHFSYIVNVCRRYVGEDAEDVAQDTFVKAWRFKDGFRGDAAPRTWLHKIAVTTCLNHIKTKSRRLPLADRDDEPETPHLDTPDGIIEQEQTLSRISDTVDGMSVELGLTLLLNALDGLKYEEIAEQTNVPLGTVRSRLHRARLMIQEEDS